MSMSNEDRKEEDALPESRLGTKEHWDSVYEREVSNFQEFGEEGEVWFGEDAVERMVDYLSEVLPLTSPDDSASTPAPPRILDVGTGNGHLLFALVEAGSPQTVLKGIDYSAPSIDLAKALGKSKEMEGVIFEVADLMDQEQVEALGKWDVVCDKGTFDAIALSSQPISGKLPVAHYASSISTLTKPGGTFLITSCNFTSAELISRFDSAGFDVREILPVPTFTFGGAKGSTTTSIAFLRR